MSCHIRLFRHPALIFCATLTLMLLTASSLCAQLPQRPGYENGKIVNTAGLLLIGPLDPGKVKEAHSESPDRHSAYRDSEKEFLQLQLANRSLANSIGQSTTADYTSIRKEAAKINQSASRLKSSLLLPKPGDIGRRKSGAGPLSLDELRTAIALLDALVHGFVWNPFFRNLVVVDSEKSLQASRDLEEIISLSGQIRKSAEGLMR